MPGFSRQQQARLSALVRNHRRKFRNSDFKELPKRLSENTRRLCILLRLAVLLHRGRSRDNKPMLYLDVSDKKIKVSFPDSWLDDHPLTRIELEREAEYLAAAGYKLKF
jgi:exopolyphosphatase/guanosine-5'-triphosphate,3'-diphosphate pyrophosphatase